jgi:hypothetical protein
MMRDYCISAANAAVNDWQKKRKRKEKNAVRRPPEQELTYILTLAKVKRLS